MKSVLVVALLGAWSWGSASAQVAMGSIAGADITFQGLVQADANWYDSDVADLDGDPGDDADADYALRRAQLILKGRSAGAADWVVAYDAKADKWLDVNARLKFDKGRQFVQLGQFKQPNGLEALSASRHNDFMSQAMVSNTFAIGRRLGVAYSFDDPYDRGSESGDARHRDWGFTASWFGRELTRDLAHGSGFGVRGTWAVLSERGRILHLGLSYVDHDTHADSLRLRARPNADLTPVRLVDTGTMADTDRIATVGAEAFWVAGPLKFQAEYMDARVDRYGPGSDDFQGTGGYVSGVWNLTGETWGYKGGEPATQVGAGDDAGMWQLGLRYDVLDLDDHGLRGGRMKTWTAGVNWYWRRHLKVVLNYVAADSERAGVDDDPGIAEARVQFHW